MLLLRLCALTFFCLLISPVQADEPQRTIFDNVRVVAMVDGADIIAHGHVIVADGEIVAVGTGPAPADSAASRRIDGGGAFLIPGLSDMHVHYWDPEDGILYLANGITTVRNLTGSTQSFALDQAARDGSIAGPRVYTSGPLIDGDPPIRSGGLVVTSPEQAIGAVRAQWASGFPAVKLYERLDADSFKAAIDEARRLEMKVFSHTPIALTIDDMLALEIDSIEHLDGYSSALVRDGFTPTQYFPWAEEWANADPAKYADYAERTRDAGVWSVPTFALVYGQRYSAESEAFFVRPEMRFLSEALRDGWRSSIDSWLARFHPFVEAEFAAKIAFVGALREAGAPVLIGTDPPNRFVIPGFAIHDEFEAFAAAGYTNEDILRIATTVAAGFIDRGETSGRIAEGYTADLVLVADDPTTDLATLRRPLGVMVAGNWYDRAALDAALEERARKITRGEIAY